MKKFYHILISLIISIAFHAHGAVKAEPPIISKFTYKVATPANVKNVKASIAANGSYTGDGKMEVPESSSAIVAETKYVGVGKKITGTTFINVNWSFEKAGTDLGGTDFVLRLDNAKLSCKMPNEISEAFQTGKYFRARVNVTFEKQADNCLVTFYLPHGPGG